jgi:hypothetical protein
MTRRGLPAPRYVVPIAMAIGRDHRASLTSGPVWVHRSPKDDVLRPGGTVR